MKLGLKVGDKAKVLKGKYKGKEANVVAIDKKTARVRLAGIKVEKGKKDATEGTFHRKTLELVKAEAPKQEEAATEEAATEAPAEEAKAE